MIVAMLSAEPVGSALEKAKLLGGEVLALTAQHFAREAAADETTRAHFIAEAAKLPDDLGKKALFQMARAWSFKDPEAALSSMGDIFTNEDQLKRVKEGLVGEWAKREPQQALAWLGENPPPDLVDQQALIWKRWAIELPEAANQWLMQQGDSPALAETIVRQIQSRQLNQTLGLGGRAARREAEALRRTYRVWATAKPEQAADWLTKADPQIALVLTRSEP